MGRGKQRVVMALVSSVLGLIIVAWILERRPDAGTVELVDTRDEVAQYFLKRSNEKPEGVARNTVMAAPPSAPLMVGRHNYADLPRALAKRMFPTIRKPNPRSQYDPYSFYWGKAGFRYSMPGRTHPDGDYLMVNNSLGFRRETELSQVKPDLRVIVTGDSHTEGVVPMHEHLTEVAEAILRRDRPERSVEVINAGVGGYMLYNYSGVARKFEGLTPDVFVVVVYGGNDFSSSVGTYRFFHRLPVSAHVPKEFRAEWKRLSKESTQLFAQSLNQVIRLHCQPQELALAKEAISEFVQDTRGICEQAGSKFVLMYLPSLFEVQPHLDEEGIRTALENLGWNYEELTETSDLANSMLQEAESLGVPCIDLRDAFRAASEPLYWDFDHHINTAGHALAAKQLSQLLDGLGDGRPSKVHR